MKKIFIYILTLLLIIPYFTYGQSYYSVIDTGKIWSIKESSSGNPYPFYNTRFVKIDEDTLIGNKYYSKVNIAWRTINDTNLTAWKMSGFIYEENKRIFYRDTLGNEGKIYDFNFNLNDTFFISNVRYMFNQGDSTMIVVDDIDSIFFIDKYYKRFSLKYFFNDSIFYGNDTWIEGIGSLMGLDNAGYNLIGMEYTLLCFTRNDTLLYHNPNYQGCFYIPTNVDFTKYEKNHILIYPNPIIDNFIFEQNNKTSDIKLIEFYDQLGVKVKSIENINCKIIQVQKINFNTGLYIYKVYLSDDSFICGKLIVE